jgi:uncharacterized protein (TIGR00369 family)
LSAAEEDAGGQEGQPNGAELFRAFMEHSPFGLKLGLRLEELEPDRCRIALPFDESLATYGSVVHGGALATLVDTAATGAAWSDTGEGVAGGGTVDLTIHYLRPADGDSLVAEARVIHRGRSVCSVEVEVTSGDDEEPLVKALVTYKLKMGG